MPEQQQETGDPVIAGRVESVLSRIPEGLSLYPFQREGVARALELQRCLIADDMGLGKTVQALLAIEAAGAYPCVIICPAFLRLNWGEAISKWLPARARRSVIAWRIGADFRRADFDFAIASYETVSPRVPGEGDNSRDRYPAVEAIAEHRPQGLVIDEAHYIKNGSSHRSRAVRRLSATSPRAVFALTGTPVINRPVEMVPILQALRRLDDMGGYTNYRRNYCGIDPRTGRLQAVGRRQLQEHSELLRQRVMIRRLKSEVLTQLPPKVRNTVPVEMSAEGAAEYRRIERDFFNWLVEREGVAAARSAILAEALVKFGKLRLAAAKAKLASAVEWIMEFHDNTDRKLVVFFHHREIGAALQSELTARGVLLAGMIVGGIGVEQVSRHVRDFQERSSRRMILVGIKAGGVGITLTAASDVAFVEFAWTGADHDQAEDRTHRIGQENHVQAWYLPASGTVDEQLLALIAEKRLIAAAAVDGMAAAEAMANESSNVEELLSRWQERMARQLQFEGQAIRSRRGGA